MTIEEARTAMISGVPVTCDGRRYRIRSLYEIPVANLNSRMREMVHGITTAPTTHFCELLNNANCIEHVPVEEVAHV